MPSSGCQPAKAKQSVSFFTLLRDLNQLCDKNAGELMIGQMKIHDILHTNFEESVWKHPGLEDLGPENGITHTNCGPLIWFLK